MRSVVLVLAVAAAGLAALVSLALASPSSAWTSTPSVTRDQRISLSPIDPLTVTVANSSSLSLSWGEVVNAARVRIWRDETLVDQISWSASSLSYTDRNLWPSTSYFYSVRVFNSQGLLIARFDGSGATPARSGNFPRPFAVDSFINTPIGASPKLAPNSAAIVRKSFVAYAGKANMSNSDYWGVPIAYADARSDLYRVACTRYGCDIPVPWFGIPWIAQPSLGSDERLTVLEPSGRELDMWDDQRLQTGWQAGARTVLSSWGSGINCAAAKRCGHTNAAGFAQLAGVIRPEEIAQGRINHALVITTPFTRAGYIACPAKHTDGKFHDPDAIPEGARIQLDPSVDVNVLPISKLGKVIARALQVSGAYVVDTGGTVSIRAESNRGRGYNAWATVGISSSSPDLTKLPWSRMRVLRITNCG
jgi:hypothetical protein